jgi:hypothetical protein
MRLIPLAKIIHFCETRKVLAAFLSFVGCQAALAVFQGVVHRASLVVLKSELYLSLSHQSLTLFIFRPLVTTDTKESQVSHCPGGGTVGTVGQVIFLSQFLAECNFLFNFADAKQSRE